MAGKTVTQRVDELAEKVEGYIPVTDYRLVELKQDFSTLKQQVRQLEALPQQVSDLKERVKQLEAVESQAARHDERLKAMEKTTDKSSDRRW